MNPFQYGSNIRINVAKPTSFGYLIEEVKVCGSYSSRPDKAVIKRFPKSIVYVEHYPENTARWWEEPVQMLTFTNVGYHQPVQVLKYAKTCRTVNFLGNLTSTNACFGIIRQLNNLKKVTFTIGPDQVGYLSEDHIEAKPCLSVKKLKIIVDHEMYKDDSMTEFAITQLVEAVLVQAKNHFPNLSKLYLKLPEDNVRMQIACGALIKACPKLRRMLQPVFKEGQRSARRNRKWWMALTWSKNPRSTGRGRKF